MDNAQFISTNPRALAIYTQGWEDGHRQGHQDGCRDAGNAAELAAVRFYTLEATDAHNRVHAADAAKALHVPRFRERPAPKLTIRTIPTLAQFLDGLRRGGILNDRQGAAA